tara:strand:- start:135 stop:347 length:213 start_codon:yes stop_codon:yes gene_type:complete
MDMQSEEWISTECMAAEINLSSKTLQRFRKEGVLLPGRDYYRSVGKRGPLFWNRHSVLQAIRGRTALLES